MNDPPPKRPKLDDDDDDGRTQIEEIVDTVWEHYRNFLDSLEDGEGEEDDQIDQIQELIEIVKTHISKPSSSLDESASIGDPAPKSWKSRTEFLPILVSVGYHHLADRAIAQYLLMYQQQQQQQIGSSLKNETVSADSNSQHTDDDDENENMLDIDTAMKNAQHFLTESLEWFPCNAATISMGANFGRMSQTLSLTSTRKWYERAVETSVMLRPRALQALEDGDTIPEVKEWIEFLILNEIVGTQYEDDDDDSEDEEEDREGANNDEINQDKMKNDENCIAEDDEDDKGSYSSSAVESTARFMCAMLWSMEGRHDKSLDHLRNFQLTHRLHPNVWKIGKPLGNTPTPTQGVDTEPTLSFQPPGGILPSHLYDAMTKLFAPSSAYWIESDYANRGYYSFFHEYDGANAEQPRNLIEEIVVNHMIPRAEQCLVNMAKNSDDEKSKSVSTTICGYEWWVHTRPIKANLGHNLHFDTDECMLAQEGKVTHPVLSSVLYLTGGGGAEQSDLSTESSPSPAGATIILDQTPESETVGESCWQGIPEDNTLLIFPGNRLHGVLPCPGNRNQEIQENDETSTTKIKTLIDDWTNNKSNMTRSSPSHSNRPSDRLTFMVGFWTRNVPADMKQRSLYGPCGPLPPATKTHTWVSEIMEGYNTNGTTNMSTPKRIVAEKIMTPTIMRKVSPAWECIQSKIGDKEDEDENKKDPHLVIPHGIDHRFFVRDAPYCFRQSLFEGRNINH